MSKEKSVIMSVVITLFLSYLITGCQSTGVIPMGDDSYMIAKKDGAPGVGISYTVKAEVYQEANAFCSQKGLGLETIEVHTLSALPGRLGSTELRFRCVAKGDKSERLPTQATGMKDK